MVLALWSCNATRWVPEGQRLLVRNEVTVELGTLDPEDIASIIKQKPNKRIFGRPLYLDLYNLRDPEKVVRKRMAHDSICNLENEERRQKGKSTRICDRASRGRNGEPPVILDSTLIARSVEQIRSYAIKEGYFEARVSDTIHFTRRLIWPWKGWGKRPFNKPKAAVEYVVKAGRPWTICQVERRIDDPRMAAYVTDEWEASLLKPGDRFDGDVIDAERTRISEGLRSQGYLFFTRDMVLFDADTSAGDHEVDLLLRLERPMAQTQRGLKGTPEGTVYYLNDVIVDTRRRGKLFNARLTDTLRYDGTTILYHTPRPEFKPRPLTSQLFLRENDRYDQREVDRSFRRLTATRVFDRVEITFDTTGVGRPGYANCRVSLLPAKRQGLSIETFGTNRGGFLGTSLNFGYKHKNVFRSMALLQTNLTFGWEAQQKISASSSSDDASTSLGRDALFNTLEIGPEVTLRVPTRFGAQKAGGSKFIASALYNFQQRPDYTRTLAKGSIGVEWYSSPYQTFSIYPAELNVISIPVKSSAFAAFIDSTNDAVLRNSYTDHMIAGWRVAWTGTTQGLHPSSRNVFFGRGNLEFPGLFIGPVIPLAAISKEVNDPVTGSKYYTLGGVRYAQYVKIDLDGRWYHTIHERSNIAARVLVGLGKPYNNLEVLPFEASFFGGGANDIRAWRARSLGPGGYRSSVNSFDRIGEMRIEGNFEYRFKMFGYLEGALFADAGNIWFLQPNPAKPGGEFKWDRFLSEMAIGTGVGARLNFDFFIIRFDLALQTKDPGLPEGQRWIFEKKDPGLETSFGDKLNLNLGINYPF